MITKLPREISNLLHQGTVIPAHPLILDKNKKLDRQRQRAVARYYLDAGAGGLAVGVHTTQFAIRTAGLYEPVLQLAAETTRNWSNDPKVLIAGVAGKTEQALREVETANRHGYHFAMVNFAAFQTEPEEEILAHCERIAREIPIIGFALLRECGGRVVSKDFWKSFCQIENVHAIKMAPFNRYQTLDVVRGLVEAGMEKKITLYTGNDDHIVLDLISPFVAVRNGERISVNVQGGLLGHWSVWTKSAVELFKKVKEERSQPSPELLALDSIITDCNAAVYDGAHDLKGCIPGCLEVLRRQGLAEYNHCLDPEEILSPGQSAEIDRIYKQFPEWTDDDFVQSNLSRWMKD